MSNHTSTTRRIIIEEIVLRTINHKDQRYETVGDWLKHLGRVEIRTSKLSCWELEFLILVHELVEWGLCKKAGITQDEVDVFDKAHEKEQDEVELGDLRAAPYTKQHGLATSVERMLAAELGIVWSEYEEELNELMR